MDHDHSTEALQVSTPSLPKLSHGHESPGDFANIHILII
jgi:hypothetical protein